MIEKPAAGSYEIGYVPDRFQLYDHLKVMEYMEFYAGLYQIPKKMEKKWLREINREMEWIRRRELTFEKICRYCVEEKELLLSVLIWFPVFLNFVLLLEYWNRER